MIKLRKTCFLRVTALVLVFLFLFQADVLLGQTENPDAMFEQARQDYLKKNYEKAASQLQRLTAHYENTADQNEELKSTYGRILLLLGACYENMQLASKAEEMYMSAKVLLGEKYFIEGVSLEHLTRYAKIFDVKTSETKNENRVIAMETTPKTKKKFPWLIVAGAAVVVTLVYLLLIKKSSKYTLTVNVGDGITGSPASGTYRYKKNEIVNYNYLLKSGYRDLVVRLDGSPVSASGSINIYGKHTLTVSCTKIGRVNNVTVKFTVRFAATNLEVRHRIWVDNSLKIDETLKFQERYSDDWYDAGKIYRTFNVSTGYNKIEIEQEAGPGYSHPNSGNAYIWGTYYELEITNYTYIEGADPGRPSLSEDWFYLYVAPWRNDPSHEWYRIKTREITINPPSTTAFPQKKEAPQEPPRADSSKH